MNVSLRKQIFLILLLALALPCMVRAGNVVLETFQGQAVELVFTSSPNDPYISIYPANGTASLLESPPLTYTLTYQPDPQFIGVDNIRIYFWNSPISFEALNIEITVLPSKVIAVHDYVTISLNTPVSIDVLANDSSSNGVLILKNIPLVNNGIAAYTQGSPFVQFTPNSGFEGIAHLNYVVCDDIGTCDHGTVSIYVVGESVLISDTLRLFTKKNEEQVVLLPNMFVLTSAPNNGTIDESGDVANYIPDEDFAGIDYMSFSDGGLVKVVEMNVVDVQDNIFAVDDKIYITPVESVEFNVLENDIYGYNSGCFHLTSQAKYGTVVKNPSPKGSVTYYPPPGFEGVDWFTYGIRPPACSGEEEIATVYVFVSNYAPSSVKFTMFTPKLTPLVIGYNAPITNFEFQIEAQGQLGEAIFLTGQVDTLIYGQLVSGYNLILYIPHEDVTSGLDEFEMSFCVLTNGECSYQRSVKIEVQILDIGDGGGPMCFDDCVWAGDTNFDGVVNMGDLLPLGICMGEIGIPRNDVDFNYWYGQYGEDWEDPFEGAGIDLKHLDTDGDSIVTALDTFAISEFYGYTHFITPAQVAFYEDEIILSGDIFANPGDLVELDMLLGKEDDPAVDVYGFTFPFEYNPTIFIPGSVSIGFGNSSWLTYNSPVLHMTRNNMEGLIESGFTRTSGVSASGHGVIGTVRFIVSDDIEGFRPGDDEMLVNLGGGTATIMNSAGQTFGINISDITLHVIINQPEEEEESGFINPDLLKIYPNPARDYLNVHLNGGHDFEQLIIYNLTGQRVYDTGKMLANRVELSVNNLQQGMYLMTVLTEDGVINKKFEVIK